MSPAAPACKVPCRHGQTRSARMHHSRPCNGIVSRNDLVPDLNCQMRKLPIKWNTTTDYIPLPLSFQLQLQTPLIVPLLNQTLLSLSSQRKPFKKVFSLCKSSCPKLAHKISISLTLFPSGEIHQLMMRQMPSTMILQETQMAAHFTMFSPNATPFGRAIESTEPPK